MINLHERMLPTSKEVEPVTSWSPVGRRIHLSHDFMINLHKRMLPTSSFKTWGKGQASVAQLDACPTGDQEVAGSTPATSWSPVGQASNWATEARPLPQVLNPEAD